MTGKMARQSVSLQKDDKSPLTLAEVRVLLEMAAAAGIPDTTVLDARVNWRGKLTRLDASG